MSNTTCWHFKCDYNCRFTQEIPGLVPNSHSWVICFRPLCVICNALDVGKYLLLDLNLILAIFISDFGPQLTIH